MRRLHRASQELQGDPDVPADDREPALAGWASISSSTGSSKRRMRAAMYPSMPGSTMSMTAPYRGPDKLTRR